MKENHYICRRMFFRVLWPSLISALALSLANMADAVAVGSRMGESGLAAIGIVTPLYMLYNVVGFAFSTGGCVTHSRLTAAGKEGEALAHFKSMALGVLCLSVLIAALGNLLLRPLLALLGAGPEHPELRELCEQYARPLFAAAPVFLLNLLLYDFTRCDDGTRLATLGFTVGCVLDLVLNILFVLVLDWGVRGSAWATVIAQTASVAIMSLHFVNGAGVLHNHSIRMASHSAETPYLIGRSLRIGLSTSSRYVFQFLFLIIGNRLLLQAGIRGVIDGEVYVAVFDVVLNVSYLAYGLYQAFSDTMQPLAATFAAEHDRDDLRYLLRIALNNGLIVGSLVGALICVLAVPISRLFGITGAESLKVSAKAIPIFCLSTPFAGVSIILTGYYQSTGQERLASYATLFRTVLFLLPVTFMAGLLFPYDFWWLFLVSETGSLCVLLLVSSQDLGRQKSADIPVFSATMDQDHRELEQVMEGVERFCEEQEVPMKKAMQIQLAVEELCAVTQEVAFTGQKDEYICLTIAAEKNGDYVLHIRNSAAYFNPLDMRMDKLSADAQEDLLASIGVMMVRKQAKDFYFRNYQGFNVMTVVL